MSEFLLHRALGNSFGRWLIAAVVAVVTIVVLRIVASLVVRRAEKFARGTKMAWDDAAVAALETTRWFSYLLAGAFAGSQVLTLSAAARRGAEIVASLVLLLQAGLWLHAAIRTLVTRWKADAAGTPERATGASAVGFVARLTVWTTLALLGLSVLGVRITALLAGLGVGGVAAALAVQSLLGDVIASLSIYFDRPFDIGEFIVTPQGMGTVERISMCTTRLRALGGEELVFANGVLIKQTIQNFGRMRERRVVLEVGVEYSTPAEKLEALPALLSEVVGTTGGVRLDRAHFRSFGAYALIFEVIYWVQSADYTVFMDKQQHVNFGVIKRLQELGVSMAFPTQTVFVSPQEGALSRA